MVMGMGPQRRKKEINIVTVKMIMAMVTDMVIIAMVMGMDQRLNLQFKQKVTLLTTHLLNSQIKMKSALRKILYLSKKSLP